jgi:ABC-2 type transport system ATP-binding protein
MEIQITNLVKKYHNTEVLNINQLQIKEGEIIGLLGNNGAGKTTLLRLMLDLVKADNGYVRYNNMDIVAKTDKWKEYVGAFLDNDFLIDFLYPEEYFTFVGKLHSLSKSDIFQKLEYFESFFNDEILNKKKLIRDLSNGNKKKVGIVSALLHEPEIIILDEPFNMIDPSSKIKLGKILKNINKNNNSTIIISSNILEPIIRLSTRIILLEKGKIIKNKEVSTEYINELTTYFFDN